MLECNTVYTPGYGSELSNEQPEEKLLGARETKLYQETVGSPFFLAQVPCYGICYVIK